MKKTDMELQAIREKLRLLESEPAAGDVLSMPWSTSASNGAVAKGTPAMDVSRVAEASYVHKGYSSAPTEPSSRPTAAIEALQNRAGNTQNRASDRRVNELIAQEIHRLEEHANNINERSQQQAVELQAMKRSAQQAAFALHRQGIHEHPQLDVIAELLATCPSATVPHIERDQHGYFTLGHSPVDLRHAEQEAVSTAEALRHRSAYREGPDSDRYSRQFLPPLVPFTEPIESDLGVDDYAMEPPHLPTTASRSPRKKSGGLFVSVRRLFGRLTDKRRSIPPFAADGSQVLASSAATSVGSDRFSFVDGTIWFSAAAITRIVLEAIVLSYPLLRMPFLLILFSAISFSIYRVVVSSASSRTSAFRLGVVLLGLFLGGSLI